MEMDLSEEYDERSLFKISKEAARNAANGHQLSMHISEEGVNEALRRCRRVQKASKKLRQQLSESFLGRASLILSESLLRKVVRFLPPKYACFKAFV